MSPAQMVTVIITRDDRSNGRSRWIQTQTELDSLVRRMGFDIVLTAHGTTNHRPAGMEPVAAVAAYQVTGARDWPLHDDGMDTVRRELGNLVYLYSIPALSVGFGSIDTHLDL